MLTHRLENAALACGVLAWFIAGPVLVAFAVVLGVKSWLRVLRIKALVGVILGALDLMASMLHILKPYLRRMRLTMRRCELLRTSQPVLPPPPCHPPCRCRAALRGL
jgi:hypothetical protein